MSKLLLILPIFGLVACSHLASVEEARPGGCEAHGIELTKEVAYCGYGVLFTPDPTSTRLSKRYPNMYPANASPVPSEDYREKCEILYCDLCRDKYMEAIIGRGVGAHKKFFSKGGACWDLSDFEISEDNFTGTVRCGDYWLYQFGVSFEHFLSSPYTRAVNSPVGLDGSIPHLSFAELWSMDR